MNVKMPTEKISLTPSFFAINNPPPIVKTHAGHISLMIKFTKCYCNGTYDKK